MADSPADGDVLITSDGRGHFISVVPHPHRLSFASLTSAMQLAARWAANNHARVWLATDGKVTRISDLPAAATDKTTPRMDS